ncbi:carboxypeptidase Y-deficient [Coemansia spiralis]|uniref:Carboxypeptidase Y-deficient n=1 Tax=Coemansia spiralis TaxID=417178 RepID=A0A9W8G9N1_9FUNG|nr:carboxypeptidase Y-deficient [Coemansia spiralis]
MSQTPGASPLRKNSTVQHVRRAARTLGPSPAVASSPSSAKSFASSDGQAEPQLAFRQNRSQSISANPVLAQQQQQQQQDARRSTVSLGSFQTDAPSSTMSPTADGSLRCPICGVMAPSLFALNVHLDDIHFAGEAGGKQHLFSAADGGDGAARPRYAAQDDLEDVKGAILGFFRGAGRAVKGLGGIAPASPPSVASSDNEEPAVSGNRWRQGEQDGADRDLVSRAHWQQMRQGGRCGVPACATVLTAQTGALNCRWCGRLMCAQHCNRRLRLSASAQPSARGVHCRVCDDCQAKTADAAGRARDLTAGFAHLRRKAVNAALLEGNRIEKRLEKLALVHGSAQQSGSVLAPPAARSRALQAAEQTVVVWEDDSAAARCPFCLSTFGRVASRRHHCRLCGRVVCARPGCSVQLLVPLPLIDGTGFSPASSAEIRCCTECEHTVLRQRDRAARSQPQAPELARLYAHARSCMAQIEELLPTFNALALRLRDALGPGAPDLPRAARIRKQLTSAFNELDAASKRIVALPARSTSDCRVHAAIRRGVAQYLQLHMFPLTMLPRPERRPQSRASVASIDRQSPLRIQQRGVAEGNEPSSLPSSASTANMDARGSIGAVGRVGSANSGLSNNSAESTATGDTAAAETRRPEDAKPDAQPQTLVSSVSGAATGIATSLLSFVRKPSRTDAGAAGQEEGEEEMIRSVLASDPGRQQRLAAMRQEEKIASLEVLRDQRQRVLGYIGDAQRERRIDDAVSLQASLDELDIELSLIERAL